MKDIKARVVAEAKFMIENSATTRSMEKEFGLSRTTIYNDLTLRLKVISPELYSEVNKIMQINKQERSQRGAETTKRKFKNKQVIS